MSTNAAVRTHIDEYIKEEAPQFEPLVPNATTLSAMKESRQGGLKSFDSLEDLIAGLNTER